MLRLRLSGCVDIQLSVSITPRAHWDVSTKQISLPLIKNLEELAPLQMVDPEVPDFIDFIANYIITVNVVASPKYETARKSQNRPRLNFPHRA